LSLSSLLWVVFAYFTFWNLNSISLLPLPSKPSHIPMMRVKATTSVSGH
jgi:hypothetical protein